VTQLYDGGADTFDPDRFVREAMEDGDEIAAATIALESYGWQLYGFIVRQVQPDEVDEVFARVVDEMLRGLVELMARARVRDWIYTLVHGAWIRTQAGDPAEPLGKHPELAHWVQQLIAGFRSAHGLEKRERARGATNNGEPALVVVGGGGGLPRQLHAQLESASLFGRTMTRRGMERIAMQRIR
jgi:hypothetical protein